MIHIPPKHYIDRDSVAKALSTVFSDKEHGDPHFMNGILTATDFILDYPTEDVEEVRHGYWRTMQNNGSSIYYCSRCGRHVEDLSHKPQNNFPYCSCGAKMCKEKEE